MTSTQPSVVIISINVIIACPTLLKFSSISSHDAPGYLRQSALVLIAGYSPDEHFWKFPLKKSTPIMPKIIKKIMQTVATLPIEGIDWSKALTITFMPGSLEIILKGLNALKALSAFNDYKEL
jgi:hypothetical protein